MTRRHHGIYALRRGVIPGFASHVTVARVAGLSTAAELMMSGRTIRGTEAVQLGLATKALPAAEVLPAACALGREIAENAAPVAVAIVKRLLWQGAAASPSDMKRREDRLFAWIGAQPDAREGVEAFVEKRPPRWSQIAPFQRGFFAKVDRTPQVVSMKAGCPPPR